MMKKASEEMSEVMIMERSREGRGAAEVGSLDSSASGAAGRPSVAVREEGMSREGARTSGRVRRYSRVAEEESRMVGQQTILYRRRQT